MLINPIIASAMRDAARLPLGARIWASWGEGEGVESSFGWSFPGEWMDGKGRRGLESQPGERGSPFYRIIRDCEARLAISLHGMFRQAVGDAVSSKATQTHTHTHTHHITRPPGGARVRDPPRRLCKVVSRGPIRT